MPEAEAVSINGTPVPWREGLTVADLLALQARTPESIATALNGAFVPRTQRERTLLQPGDAVTVFEAIVGG